MIYVGEVMAVLIGFAGGYSYARARNRTDTDTLNQLVGPLAPRVDLIRKLCQERAFDDTTAQKCWRFRQASVLLGEASDHIRRAEGEP